MKRLYFLAIVLIFSISLFAKKSPMVGGDCAPAISQKVLKVNKIRARLLGAGDMWWNDGFQVPNPFTGEVDDRLKINGAGIWIGGIDPGGSLKLAAATPGEQSDFFSGPLNQYAGTTDRDDCALWDKHFSVTKEEIEEHLLLYRLAEAGEIEYTEEMIPKGVKG